MYAFPKDFAIFAEGWIPSAAFRGFIERRSTQRETQERGKAVARSRLQVMAVAGRGMGAKVGVATRRGRGAREGAPVCI